MYSGHSRYSENLAQNPEILHQIPKSHTISGNPVSNPENPVSNPENPASNLEILLQILKSVNLEWSLFFAESIY